MSDETPGVGQSPMSLDEPQSPRPVRINQLQGGNYHLISHSNRVPVPALAQITGGTLGSNTGITQTGVARIISLSPSRHQTSLRPSLTNQSIVNALNKSRSNQNVRLQLFNERASQQTVQTRSPLKRPSSSSTDKKDTYVAKLQRVMNHRNVRSKIVKEKYNEHLLESYHLEVGGNILDLYQFAKRPKTQQFLQYIKENAIDPKEHPAEEAPPTTQTIPPTPAATSASCLPGISHQSTPQTSAQSIHLNTSVTSITESPVTVPKTSSTTKIKTSIGNQEQIVEKAKQEAYVVQRISDLQKEGLWSEKRLPKLQEMPRAKAHWDFLLEEMVWLAADFAQERKWKKAAAKKCARMVQKYFQDKALAAQKAEKAQEQNIRRIAAFCAKEIKNFWNNVEKLVEYKQNSILEEKRKKALDQHLSFIVDQTEKYSQLLAEGMNKPVQVNENVASAASSRSVSRANSDDEFQPDNQSSTDDEETIAQEEAADNREEEQSEEVAALQRESEMDFQDFLNELPKDYLENRDKIQLTDSESEGDIEDEEKKPFKRPISDVASDSNSPLPESSKQLSKKSKVDEDFTANISSEEDDEDTIQEQEKAEGEQDYEAEINDLEAENEMSVEELRKKYSGPPPVNDDLSESDTSKMSEEEAESSADEESEDSDSEGDVSNDEDGLETEIGLKSLLDESAGSVNEEDNKTDNNDLINDAAKIAESIQPKGNTLSSTSVVTPVPFLLKLPLREYQHIGLDWLVTMFERKLNGILADEMGLGKTIQTIALLAHLACEKSNWGPHLIIVPTSVMLNWEMECKKWCPGFKILTYYGTQKERKMKRTGWTKPNAFHICITSYKLVIQDHQSFRRKKWKYLILDEAQNIKNFKSQRWQLLLNFQTQQRLLLTGTPLQNNLMELWSLMHFLMPNVFQSHREFKEWFSNPVTGMIEGNSEYNESIIKRLHKVLRPFLLRRLKSEVEKQMPKKYEHVVMCRLSKRQRFLYDDYMSRAKTRETLASGNLLSVINVLMQLRKVCNHPNLFEVRPTISPFHCEGLLEHIPSIVYAVLEYNVWKNIDLSSMNFNLLEMEFHLSAYQCYRLRQYQTTRKLIEEICEQPENVPPPCPPLKLMMRVHRTPAAKDNVKMETDESPESRLKPSNMQAKGSTVTQQISSTNSTEKLPSGFAQLVQTSSGNHILFTPSSATSAIQGTTVMTSGGQRLTLLSKPTNSSTPHSIAKAVVKVQLASASTATTTSSSPSDINFEDNSMLVKTVGSKFLDKLYANQPNTKGLDVRWENNLPSTPTEKNQYDDDEVYQIIVDYEKNKRDLLARVNLRRCSSVPMYGEDFRQTVTINSVLKKSVWNNGYTHCTNTLFGISKENTTSFLTEAVQNPEQRIQAFADIFNRFIFYVPAVHAPQPEIQVWHPPPSTYWGRKQDTANLMHLLSKPATPLHPIISAMVTQFPHPRLIQYDCGKLQTLDRLLRKLKSEGHRVLIFTQMTKMLDVLEAFLNFHGHIYLRLDGTTKVDQRQMLMERFNGDARIFAFILSTRSGGVGVNLTGADTVIFYDSDWNPTMDAQAQDRCHRIGQTRDVHIYRLVSEKTIEENILKKANQKRLLGDLAIEGGNFTTAYFKSSTIQDLFNIDANEESAATRMSEVIEISKEREKNAEASQQSPEDKAAMGALENALAACEDDQDVQAARTAKAEAVADLAEFDENIPLDDQEKEKEPEVSKAEQEVENLIKQLTPIERYAMRFIEETEAAWSAEQLAAAEREIEEQKREWEQNRIAAMKEEEQRRQRELEEDNELLTFSREDATNQMWVSDNAMEEMPMWCPPTPPHQDTDIFIDHTMSFLYDINIMTESQLPPVYVKKEAVKRSRHDAGLMDSRRAIKMSRKDDAVYAPRSLFERPTPALMKMRRDLKLQKYRGGIIRPPVPLPGMKITVSKVAPEPIHNWTVHEDMALLTAIQTYQQLPLNLCIVMAGHTPNWDFVADYVNTVSITYRSPKQCRHRYETVLIPREEGKQVFEASPRKKKNKTGVINKFPVQLKTNRPMRTSQLYTQDNNANFSTIMNSRFDALKMLSNKRMTTAKTVVNNQLIKNPKHSAVLNDIGIDLENPLLPVVVAQNRAKRIADEKKKSISDTAQKYQLLKAQSIQSAGQATSASSVVTTSAATVSTSVPQATLVQATTVVTSTTTSVITTPSTPPTAAIRTQRLVASPLQNSTVVSVSGLSPAQLQAAQRLIVSPGPSKTIVSGTATVGGKQISQAQLHMIKQATLKQQQLRLQAGGLTAQAVKTTTVSIAGQTAVQVQFTQAQGTRTQYVKQATVAGKQGIARTVTETEMAALLKRQQQLKQQQVLAAAAVAGGSTQTTSIQNISPQVFAQAIQQAGSSGTQVATLVKAVSSSGVTQTVTIPVTGVTLGTAVKALTPGIKGTTTQQIQRLQIQHQLLTQKKLNQKIGIAQVTGKGGVATHTQLLVGSKPLSTAMTIQQFQQVVRSPLTVPQGPVVLAKGPPRVIPVNTGQGNKPTIQVVSATSQGIATTIRPQVTSTTLGALAGLKVQAPSSQAQQAILSQVSAALQSQNVGVRQNSPVRIQTASGTPLVAVSVQSPTIQQGTSPQQSSTERSNDQVSRFFKK